MTAPSRDDVIDAIKGELWTEDDADCGCEIFGKHSAADEVIALYAPTVAALAEAQREVERLSGVIWKAQFSECTIEFLANALGHTELCRWTFDKSEPCTCGGVEVAP